MQANYNKGYNYRKCLKETVKLNKANNFNA